MTFTFQPKTEQQLAEEREAREKEYNERNLWEKGVYDFEVLSSAKAFGKDWHTGTGTSKTGKPMLIVAVNVVRNDGATQTLVDFITQDFDYKIRNLASACEILDKYETGAIDAYDIIGKTGQVELGISKGGEKEGGGRYADSNRVANYVPKVSGTEKPISKAAAAGDIDDEIPF